MYIKKEFKTIKAKPPKEKSLENKIKKHLTNQSNVFFYKSFGAGLQIKGLPDIICSIDGLFVGLELKRKGGKPQASQIICGYRILLSGGIYIILDNYDDYLKCFDHIRNYNLESLYSHIGYNDEISFLKFIINKYKLKLEQLDLEDSNSK